MVSEKKRASQNFSPFNGSHSLDLFSKTIVGSRSRVSRSKYTNSFDLEEKCASLTISRSLALISRHPLFYAKRLRLRLFL